MGMGFFAMRQPTDPSAWEVEQLLLNARLRDEIEHLQDETFELVLGTNMTTDRENKLLESMLAWERAPSLPIADWFDPPLPLPGVATLDDAAVRTTLHDIIAKLAKIGVLLECTDHLSDRELLARICRDVLPFPEKKLDIPGWTVSWRFVDEQEETEIWLKYYATARERNEWARETGLPLPPVEVPPYPRAILPESFPQDDTELP